MTSLTLLLSFSCCRSIAKTSSGKIARQWVRRAYLQGSGGGDGSGYGGSSSGGLKVVAEWNVALDSANAATAATASSAADDGLEATTVAVPRSTTIDQDNSSSSSGGDDDRAIDPTGLSVIEVLPQLQKAVAECLEAQAAEAQIDAGGSKRASVVTVAPSSLSPDVSLVALGMDRYDSIYLLMM